MMTQATIVFKLSTDAIYFFHNLCYGKISLGVCLLRLFGLEPVAETNALTYFVAASMMTQTTIIF